MPVDSSALGFSNRWYREGVGNTDQIYIDKSTEILIFKSPYFIAAKLEAMKDRGMSDLRYSSDFEDIIYIFENRIGLLDEMNRSNEVVKEYLQNEFRVLLNLPIIEEAISSNVEQNFIYDRTKKILGIWKKFVEDN